MNLDLRAHIIQFRKVYFLTLIACAIISYALFKIIPKEYSTVAYAFATNNLSPTKILTEPNAGNQDDALRYGVEESIEQSLQLFLSNDVKMKVINKYNLADYWGIPKDNTYKLLERWDQDIKISSTALNSLKIQAFHQNAQTANSIVIDIISLADTLKHNINQKMISKTIEILEERLTTELNGLGLKSAKDSIEIVFNRNRNLIQAKISKNDHKRLMEIYYKWQDAKVNYQLSLPASFLVSKPIANSGEYRPKFLLLFVLITLSALLFEFFIISIIEKNKSGN
jgi:hypothetical protein